MKKEHGRNPASLPVLPVKAASRFAEASQDKVVRPTILLRFYLAGDIDCFAPKGMERVPLAASVLSCVALAEQDCGHVLFSASAALSIACLLYHSCLIFDNSKKEHARKQMRACRYEERASFGKLS